MDIVSKIKLLCAEHGLSLAQLERVLNFGNGSMSRWNKSSPSISKVRKVAEYFNVSLDYLIGLDNAEEIAQKNFSKETKAMQDAFNKLSPKMQKKMIAMIKAFADEEE